MTAMNWRPTPPNGMPWKYTVTEVLGDELKQVYTVTPTNVTVGEEDRTEQADTLTVTMLDLKNSMEQDMPYAKRWTDMAGNEVTGDYIGLELTVKFELQVREKAGTGEEAGEWTAADTYFRECGDSGLTGEQIAEIFGSSPNFTPIIENQRIGEGTWSGMITDLPAAIKKDEEIILLEYRVVETSVTASNSGSQNITITGELNDDGIYDYDVGNGLIQGAVFNPEGNQTTNRLDVESLAVTKVWAGDHNNIYQTRPGTNDYTKDWQVDFVIQRLTEDNGWENVQVYGSGADYPDGHRDLVVSITGTDDLSTISTTVSGLLDGTYRARELQPGWTRDESGKVPAEYILNETGAYYGSTYTASYKRYRWNHRHQQAQNSPGNPGGQDMGP